MCDGCSSKTWKRWFVACTELSEELDRSDYELEKLGK